MKCVDLQEQFGPKFKVEYEESYNAERTKNTLEDPGLMILRCQNGHICPWGDSALAACTNTNGSVATRLRKLPFVTVVQDGDDGVNAVFDVEHFNEIAKIMKPRLPMKTCQPNGCGVKRARPAGKCSPCSSSSPRQKNPHSG